MAVQYQVIGLENKELQMPVYTKDRRKYRSNSVGQAVSLGDFSAQDLFSLKKGPDPKHQLSFYSREAACPAELLQHFVSIKL